MPRSSAVYAALQTETRSLSSIDDNARLIGQGGADAAFQENRMNSNRKLVRWGALALLVTLMSGCCIAPWGGGRYHGGGYYQGGGYGGGGDHGGGGWRH
jgi:hypothetical protein